MEDKEDVTHLDIDDIDNGIFLSHKKEWNLAISNNMDETGEHSASWNKSEKHKYHMILLICEIKNINKQNITEMDS